MAFVQAQCESCGGLLTVDSDLKAAICPYCGSAYVVQDSINYFNSSTKIEHMHADVVNVSDESSSEGRLRAAEAFMKIRDYQKAEQAYKDVTNLTPQNYLGWIGLIEAHTHNYSKRIKSLKEIKTLDNFAKSAVVLAPPGVEDLLSKYSADKNKQIKNNEDDIAALADATKYQAQKVAELKDLEKNLHESITEKQNRLNTIKQFDPGKNRHLKRLIIWGSIVTGIGVIGIVASPVVGILMILIGGGLLVFPISAYSKKKKYDKEIESLSNQLPQLRLRMAEVNKERQTILAAVQHNKKETMKYE